MTTETLNPQMITLSREARGLTQAELAERTGISRSYITRMEKENFQVSDAYIQLIAQELNFHPSLFFVQAEALPAELYRQREKVSSKLISQITANINIYRINLSTLLAKVKAPVPNVPSLPITKDFTPAEAADLIRKVWKMDKGTIPNLVETMESNGVLIIPMDFGTERVDSRSMMVNDVYPVIFYNKTLLGDRLRFTLAYELGHLVMHSRTQMLSSEISTKNASRFAAEFLMPKNAILKDFVPPINIELLGDLKLKWKVSMQALLYRANDLEVISDDQKRRIITEFNDRQIRRREPKELDVIIEKPHLLRDMVTKYRSSQKISVGQMAEMLYLKEDEFLLRYNF